MGEQTKRVILIVLDSVGCGDAPDAVMTEPYLIGV